MEQQIYLIGLNYRTAGVEVRERFALTDHCSKDTWAIPLRPSGENDSAETTLDEALILSTCNRVEILAVGQGDVPGLILGPIVMVVLAGAVRAHLFEGMARDAKTIALWMTDRWHRDERERKNAAG